MGRKEGCCGDAMADFARRLKGGLLEEKGRRMLKTQANTKGLVLWVNEACCKFWQ
jgi:hypothetical protein